MNKIYKVMYSKVKQCAVVVSEIAKSHGHHGESSNVRKHAALMAAVLIALGSLSIEGMPVAQADANAHNNDFIGANDYYWYWDKNDKKWEQNTYRDLLGHLQRKTLPNNEGAGAKETGSIAAGLYAQAGMQTVTIGNRNAGQSRGSVFIGEHSGYDDKAGNTPKGSRNNYVTSVGFQSDATGWGSIAIGSNATAKNTKKTDVAVTMTGNTDEDKKNGIYEIEKNPMIEGASVALGYSAQAQNGNIAIGAYSEATTDLSVDKSDEAKSYLTKKTATSYVSVGKKGVQRRISNVADGAAATDVATVGQLQELSKELGGYKAGFGIKIATDSTDKTKNTISLNRNLGTNYTDKEHKGDEKVTVKVNDTGLVLGGYAENAPGNKNNPEVTYGATGDDSVTVGGKNGLASGRGSVAAGGMDNVASGINATVVGGEYNNAAGTQAAVLGGLDNTASGTDATASGGSYNVANGIQSAVLGGYSNNALGTGTTSIGGYGKAYDGQNNVIYDSSVNGMYSVGIAGGSTGKDAGYALAAGNQAVVTVENGTAIGYQATTDEANTIAFGHDAGDVSGYTIKWKQRTDGKTNADGTTNDYTQAPESVVAKDPYTKAGYNRLVKVADGVDAHDVVVMEQLDKAKTELTKDLSVNAGWGINIEDVTTKDENGKEMTKKNVISLKRNLGKNYGSRYGTGKVNFEADGENSLILGGGALNDSWEDRDKEVTYGAHGKDSILVGGLNNDIAKDSEKVATNIGTKASIGTRAVIIGGTSNTVSYDPVTEKDPDTGKEKVKVDSNGNVIVQTQKTGTDAIIVGGLQNTAKGDGSVLIGGESNEATGFYSTVIGGTSNKTDGWLSSIFGGTKNTITGAPTAAGIFGGTGNTINSNGIAANVFGGENNTADNTLAVVVGGEANTSSGPASIILGGNHNTANQLLATVVGGQLNTATGETSMISGGIGNVTSGAYSYDAGGLYNRATGIASSALGGRSSSVNGMFSTGVAGGSTGQDAFFSLAAGYKSVVADSGVEKTFITGDDSEKIQEDMEAGKELSGFYMGDPSDMPELGHTGTLIHYDKFSTALGYQATANKPGTISFGHDAGDESGYTYEWEQLPKDKDGNQTYASDGTTNDYTKAPKSIKKNAPYTSAYYNRLVKVADGIDDHDVVVMEQLKQYAEKDASNIGNNLTVAPVYQKDDQNNIKLGADSKPLVDEEATQKKLAEAQKANKDAWGLALGAGTLSTADAAKNSDQLITGKTLYNYDKPTTNGTYVNQNQTTGQNLSALDTQVKANTDALTKPNHNIKYYSVTAGPSLGYDQYTNENNDGAKGTASLAAGNVTHTDGAASTVVGSYSAVFGTGLQGAAALSYGTVNVNNNTDTTKKFSGVANSIVGQANMTTNSNAAIIYGAGNIVTDSYRPIDEKKAAAILGSVNDPAKLGETMKDAVKESGGQVMVMGGGNTVDKAYMSQVIGVGNTVKGNQVQNTKSEWVTDTSDTAIKGYDKDKSSQYNYVDGFSNEVINGKHDYVIGANNKLSGDSYDDDTAQPIKRSNRSNIVIGDNHTLTREQNTVIIGSSDTENTQTKARDAVIIGHNANATNDTGADNAVAIGRSATATGGNAVTIGVNTSAGANSITIGSESSAISGSNIAIGRYARVYGDKVANAVALGQMAEAHVADGVAIGSGSIATVAGSSAEGYDPVTGNDSTDATATWKATNAAVSIGKADGTVTRQINGLAAGTKDTDAVNVAQLKSLQSGLTNDLTNKGLTFAANSGKAHTAKLGDTVTIQGTAKKDGHEYTADNLTTEIDKDGNITILMDKNMSVERLAVNGKDGENGQPGTPGSIGISGQDGKAGVGIDGKNGISIKGKDGKDGVTIKVDNGKDGKDGSEGHIGLTGRDGSSADIIIKKGYDDKDKGINGTNGVDGKDGITRIVYTDNTGEHQVATLEDGLKFKGDDDTVIAKKLNNTLDIIGGAKGDLTEGNIGVNSTTDGKLKVQLAKDLTSITSISNQKTEGDKTTGAKIELSTDGTTTVSGGNVSVSGGKITNVGTGIEKDGAGNITEASKTNAANIGDVQTITESATNGLTNKGLTFAANSGTNYTAKLGSTVKIQGTTKKDGHEYTADNLTTEIDGSGNITIKMDKNISAEKIAVNGKDGKSGVGIDGKDGISIKGQDGKDGVTIKGVDGVDGVDGAEGHIGLNGKDGMTDIFTTAGKPGLNGKDGETMTRIVYKDPNGTEHQTATLDDGLKFKGDDETVIAKKLNNQLDIIGGADSTKLTEKNIGVNSTTDGKLKVQLAKDLKGITSISNQNTTKVDGKDVTTGAKIDLGEDGSVNVNGGKITNVGSGADASGKYTETTNAANIGDVQTIAENTATSLTGKGLKFAANSGTEYTAKLGSTVKIQGTGKKDGHEYTADNLTTEIDGSGNITILMDKDMSTETLAVNGKDGKDGQPGTAGSIGISGRDGKAGVGIDGKDGISIKGHNGKDGVTIKGIDGVDGVDGAEGHIGLNGKDGMTDIFTTAGKPGLNGKDGETMTRIVYKDPKGTEHEAATLDDGLKFKGDDDTVIAKNLNNTMEIIGGANSENLTDGNIGVNSTKDNQLKVQLAKDLKGITSISNQKTEGDKTTGAKITLGNDGSVDVNGGKITNVDSGADASGNYTTKTNAANIGDVQKIVKDAVDSASDTTTKALAGKANINASNIGANLKGADGKAAATEEEKTKNENAWGSAIGTGKIAKDNGQLVTGKTVYEYNRPIAEDGKKLNYVSEDKTTGQNLGALDSHVKNNADAIQKNSESIQNITNNVQSLSENAVKYEDSSKKKVNLGGEGGTTITNVKDGKLSDDSTEAVNGRQLNAVQKQVTNNTSEITKIKNGDFTDASKTAIHNIAKDAVEVVDGVNTTVKKTEGTAKTPTTYAVNVEGNGKVASGNTGLISGGTLYNEVHVDKDGSYVKSNQTVGQNLSALDSGLKTTSDLIHTNTAGDTIQIGESSTATKIDVHGKDGKDRVITGVVTDAGDPTSAANVGYVNNAYGRLNNNINKAAAGSNALAALHPLDYDPDDKADFAVGYGHYRNANAAAVGAFYHPNENTMVNVGVSLGNGDPGFNAGVSFKIGSGSAGHQAMSKTEMAKVINSQSKEIDALKKDNADKDKRIDALEQKMAEILAKLDKNGK